MRMYLTSPGQAPRQRIAHLSSEPNLIYPDNNFTMVGGYLTPKPSSTEEENMVLQVCPPPPPALYLADRDDAPSSADLARLISRMNMGKRSSPKSPSFVGQLKRKHGHDSSIRTIPTIQLKPRPFTFTPPIHPLVEVQVNNATLDETSFSASNDNNKKPRVAARRVSYY